MEVPQLEVDEETYEVLSARADEKGFETTQDYVDYLMEQIVEKIRRETTERDDEEVDEKVKQKLKDLGYID
jgi:hypothetical protein